MSVEVTTQLIYLKQSILELEILLLIDGTKEDIGHVRRAEAELSRYIKILRKRDMAKWSAEADEIIDKIQPAIEQLKSVIDEIKKGIETADNVVKAFGYIDEVLEYAAKLVEMVT